MLKSIISDPGLIEEGKQRMRWYHQQMKIVGGFKERYQKEKPFEGLSFFFTDS